MNDRESTWFRVLRIAVYAFFLAALILFGEKNHPGVTLSDCLADPEKYDGEIIEVGNEAVVDSVYDGGFTIAQLGKIVPVSSVVENISPGEFVLLLAKFHQPASLEALQVHVAKKRRSKIWLSTIPALLVVGYFFRRYRFDFEHFFFQER